MSNNISVSVKIEKKKNRDSKKKKQIKPLHLEKIIITKKFFTLPCKGPDRR